VIRKVLRKKNGGDQKPYIEGLATQRPKEKETNKRTNNVLKTVNRKLKIEQHEHY
jgi:hypothetical protein